MDLMYRIPSRGEFTNLRRSFSNWGIFDAMEDKAVLIKENKSGKKKEVYLMTRTLENITLMVQPNYGGLKIGELKKKFMPSLAGAHIIAKFSKKFPFILVNESAERLVLYGRDIRGDSILETSKMLEQNQVIIILNTKKEAIGIGKTKFSGSSLLQNGRMTVSTLVDAGIYLRSQGN